MATSDPLAARMEAVVAGLDRRAQVLQLFLVAVPFSDVDGGRAVVQGVHNTGRRTAECQDCCCPADVGCQRLFRIGY